MKLLNRVFILIFTLTVHGLFAQQVPTFLNFADQKLKITDAARKDIQKDVDMLTRSPRHFQIKVDKANRYFGIIERVFKEEDIPDDFKYLVLQESALIPDAVSTSNAVGFWQFKSTAAQEMGLRVDGAVDERMNIVSSSRAAARYIKKYNNLFFNNWLYMLQAYNVGPGGALRSLDKNRVGAKKMVVDNRTHWYVKKYLAHKIAFESAINSQTSPLKLAEYNNGANESLKDIAHKFNIDQDILKAYNVWLRTKKVPDDKVYTVVIPVDEVTDKKLIALVNSYDQTVDGKINQSGSRNYRHYAEVEKITASMGNDFPHVEKKVLRKSGLSYTKINGLPGMVANEQSSVKKLAERGGISEEKFRKYNDLRLTDLIDPGQVYYFKKKKAKAKIHYYAAKQNESMWSISQKFGIRLKKLMMKNRINQSNELKPGRVLSLRFIRPAEEAVEYIPIQEENTRKVQAPLVVQESLQEEPEMKKEIPRQSPIALESTSDSGYKFDLKNQNTTSVNEDNSKDAPIQEVPADNFPANQGDNQDTDTVQETWETEENLKWLENDNISSENTNQGSQKNNSGFDKGNVSFIPFQKPSAITQNGEKIHIIKQGETLFSIARTYDITIDELREWNKLQNGHIKFDQKLIVGFDRQSTPSIQNNPTKSLTDSIILHEVGEGDTLYSIARNYNIPVEKIMELNQKTDYEISIGEKLKVIKIP